MAVQHEITRDLLVEFMHQHKIENVGVLLSLYKEIYNTVESSTNINKSLHGFKNDKKG
ncbi:hypothetical protein [Lactobacillus sp. UCMA15818]|uniref:hypothetical protein n=1 Tax=Lactobacillus sp. UCMA15818 TaxID=2583394 RepID=UPI0025B168A8|nr:hypothetical protein [Lactobacillus sp. UCMA15818]